MNQATAVAAIGLTVFAGVKGGLKVLDAKFPMFSSGNTSWVPALLGTFFAFMGIAHFSMMKEMCNIVPDRWVNLECISRVAAMTHFLPLVSSPDSLCTHENVSDEEHENVLDEE